MKCQCGKERQGGLRCPWCGLRYEEPQIINDPISKHTEQVVAEWDDAAMWDDLKRLALKESE